MFLSGLDIGSTMTKALISDEGGKVLGFVIGPTGAQHRHLALQVMTDMLDRTGLVLEDLDFIVATGYGRINVPFADKQITEITCHARGVHALFPSARTVIDIGGQDSKGIKLDAAGKVANFIMNDKCAAGTGRFLEVIADTLGVPLTEMGPLSLKAREAVPISNTCTVFAEHEVTSRLAEGVGLPEIVAGIHAAIAGRVVNLVRTLGLEKDVAVTGGGAKNIGLIRAVENQVGFPVLVPEEPLLTGALGAALLGRDFRNRGVVPKRERKLEGVTFYQ
jgi:predicted CoA-substrate-specific enzyme activase